VRIAAAELLNPAGDAELLRVERAAAGDRRDSITRERHRSGIAAAELLNPAGDAELLHVERAAAGDRRDPIRLRR
jgi:hypothetical protein